MVGVKRKPPVYVHARALVYVSINVCKYIICPTYNDYILNVYEYLTLNKLVLSGYIYKSDKTLLFLVFQKEKTHFKKRTHTAATVRKGKYSYFYFDGKGIVRRMSLQIMTSESIKCISFTVGRVFVFLI